MNRPTVKNPAPRSAPPALLKRGKKLPLTRTGSGSLLLVTAAWPAAARARTVTQAGYTLSTYATGLPLPVGLVAGMAVDPASHTLYIADSDTVSSLHKVAPDASRTVTNLGTLSPASDVNAFYPYLSTDLQLLGGNVYSYVSTDLASKPVAGGAPTARATYAGYNHEAGIAAVGTTLYVSSGNTGAAGTITRYNTATGTSAAFATVGALPNDVSSLEYDAASGQIYAVAFPDNQFGSAASARFLSINPTTGTFLTLSAILPAGTDYGNFAVDPTGLFLYTREGNVVERITIATGTVTPFVTGLTDSSAYADLVFATSSTGTGGSLYIGDGTNIREVRGFVSPVPEPSTWATLAAGLAALAFLRPGRRARRAA